MSKLGKAGRWAKAAGRAAGAGAAIDAAEKGKDLYDRARGIRKEEMVEIPASVAYGLLTAYRIPEMMEGMEDAHIAQQAANKNLMEFMRAWEARDVQGLLKLQRAAERYGENA